MAFKEGQQVRLVAPVIQGSIEDIRFNKGTEELEYLVTYTDADGEAQTRWFTESSLEVI